MLDGLFTQAVLPACLFIIMLGMGLSLTKNDFYQVAKFPKAVLIGTLGQMLVLPIVGFTIAYFFMPDAALAVGLVLLAACPGGTTSNLVTHMAKGDLALSISLTAISSMLTLVTIPLIVGVALLTFSNLETQVELPVTKMVGALLLLTLIPVSLGMWVRSRKPNQSLIWSKYIGRFSSVFLLLLIVLVCVSEYQTLDEHILNAGPATLALNVTMMLTAWWVARIAKLNEAQSTSITIEIGIQNSTLAMLIATAFLQSPAMAIPAAVYSVIMFASSAVLIYLRHPSTGASKRVVTES